MNRRIKSNKNQQGFTLIELLVVIAIIGLLANIVVTSVGFIRKRGRDARRIADLRQFNQAIQLYINDNGHAPFAEKCDYRNIGSCPTITRDTDYWKILGEELNPYISKLPEDPCGESCNSKEMTFTYGYTPPAEIANKCKEIKGCDPEDPKLDLQYNVFAEHMETTSFPIAGYYQEQPTFGFINSSVGDNF